VKDLWRTEDRSLPWRQWKTSTLELQLPGDMDLQAWKHCTSHRKIPTREGPDILRWGHSTTGNFSVKEAHYLQGNYQNHDKESIWNKVWSPALWPKVSTFLWLTVHNRVLTWDNLRKRGFIGPSICTLCQQQEETMEHLFNRCHYSQWIWDQGSQAMHRSNRNRNNIRDTLENWDSLSYKNPILARIWKILPGFTLWKIWKERNKIIFHSKASTPALTWEIIAMLIRETIRSKPWTSEDLKCSLGGAMHFPKLAAQSEQSSHVNVTNHQPSSPTTWSPPPIGFIKINFDGASKGNPGPAGFGATLRNSNGKILYLVAGFMGENTNNAAELTGLLHGLQAAIDNHFHKITLEGDSQIIIQLITKILHGENPLKISPSWRLSGLLEDFGALHSPNLTIIPSHVKREANKVADCLENEGVTTEMECIYWEAQTSAGTDLSTHCQALANRDLPTPDGVPHCAARPRGLEPGWAINMGRRLPSPHH
jgi:ribonuclease HI